MKKPYINISAKAGNYLNFDNSNREPEPQVKFPELLVAFHPLVSAHEQLTRTTLYGFTKPLIKPLSRY